ncbi:MAG TPA: hypothetical protein VLH61_09620 [Bacteroidales bacterium]|nr:hypothetical protein [Bacteroidales bacterium]
MSVRNHFAEILKLLDPEFQHVAKEKSSDKLARLLSHTTISTVFYRNFASLKLSDFPVIDKSTIRENFNDFISKNISPSQFIPVVTSGSTGTPFKTFQDKNKKKRNHADTIYFARLAGFEIGYRLIYLKIWAKAKMRHPIKYWLQNQVPVDVLHLTDARIELLIKQMESDRSTFGLLGYASALEVICQYLDRKNSGRIKSNVRSIISMSESLNDYTRLSLEKYFGVQAVARYSNLENGIIAQQELDGSGRYLVNTASYHLEILKMDTDEPQQVGELGRIVVTDLYNYAMPIIRYDTGDVGAVETDPKRPGLLFLSKVEGRKLDLLYDTKGNLVSSYIPYKNMWQYTDIIQYQLIQEGPKEYTFKINAEKTFNREAQLVAEFKSFLGADANFRVEYVDEIPLLASGKRKKIVNNYKNPA